MSTTAAAAAPILPPSLLPSSSGGGGAATNASSSNPSCIASIPSLSTTTTTGSSSTSTSSSSSNNSSSSSTPTRRSSAALTNKKPSSNPTHQQVLFRWTTPGATAVSVVGDWNGWVPLPLDYTPDAFGRGHLFSRLISLPQGRHHYKYVVDGQWKYLPGCRFEADEYGNINNILTIEEQQQQEKEGEEEAKGGGGVLECSGEGGGEPTSAATIARKESSTTTTTSNGTTPRQRMRVLDPRHSAVHEEWVSMTGEQARHKWERASRAMERLHVTRSDSVEGVISALSMHERQQVHQNVNEYGLPTDQGEKEMPAILYKSASCTYPSFAAYSSSANANATNKAVAMSSEEPTIINDSAATTASSSSSNNNSTTPSSLIRPEEKELHHHHHQHQQPSTTTTTTTAAAAFTQRRNIDADDDIHPPPTLKHAHTGLSRRGSCFLLGNSTGLPPLTRSRSLTDLNSINQEYTNSSIFYALKDTPTHTHTHTQISTKPHHLHPHSNPHTLRTLQQKQAACCAAVGSCQVKSSVRREGKMILAMVGLPGRGKTHIARAIRRHLEWLGMKVGYFNSSDYRRKTLGGKSVSPDFYDPTDSEAWACRKEIAAQVLTDTLEALQTSVIDIAVWDAANCTRARRRWITEQVRESGLYATVIFIESICTVPEIVETNVHQTILRSPEYQDLSEAEAMADFERKNQHYLSIYETLGEEEETPFLKVVNAGEKIVSYRINGYVPGRLLLLLANIHTKPRPIWFSRHGESQFNAQGRIGGDSPLSPRGLLYAEKLNEFVHSVYRPDDPSDPANPELTVWTSTMVRTGMTVAPLNSAWEVIKWRCLDEIDAGMCDGLTYQEVAAQFPEEYRKRKEDKYNYRYPRGESYQDLFLRLEPLIFEMLRQSSPVLVVGHQAILRILYGYFMGKRPEECPDLPVPLHTVIQLTPQAYECEEVWHTPMPGGEELIGSANGHN